MQQAANKGLRRLFAAVLLMVQSCNREAAETAWAPCVAFTVKAEPGAGGLRFARVGSMVAQIPAAAESSAVHCCTNEQVVSSRLILLLATSPD